MHTIGIRELKAHLSRTLRHVQQGGRYLVTDRGRVIAELRAPSASDVAELSATEKATLRLATAGELRVAERPPPRASYEPTGVRLEPGTAKAWLDWTRDEP